MSDHHLFNAAMLDLAALGLGSVSPNPLVGSLIVKDGRIVGEGYHRACGGPHAEVNAINAVKDQALLKDATLYVNLEPCTHYGKTPPCADLIVSMGIPRVVIGTHDPYPAVSGSGIRRLREANIEVITGVLEDRCRWLNRRFFRVHEDADPIYCNGRNLQRVWLSHLKTMQHLNVKNTDHGQARRSNRVHKWRRGR
jgi:diaminohydroxyphosphoribosylaminopyrimidine deaminase/5-amino-6-(5-phosphoribosylamino)uracil reductase